MGGDGTPPNPLDGIMAGWTQEGSRAGLGLIHSRKLGPDRVRRIVVCLLDLCCAADRDCDSTHSANSKVPLWSGCVIPGIATNQTNTCEGANAASILAGAVWENGPPEGALSSWAGGASDRTSARCRQSGFGGGASTETMMPGANAISKLWLHTFQKSGKSSRKRLFAFKRAGKGVKREVLQTLRASA